MSRRTPWQGLGAGSVLGSTPSQTLGSVVIEMWKACSMSYRPDLPLTRM